jgi:hypothetical protein
MPLQVRSIAGQHGSLFSHALARKRKIHSCRASIFLQKRRDLVCFRATRHAVAEIDGRRADEDVETPAESSSEDLKGAATKFVLGSTAFYSAMALGAVGCDNAFGTK